MNYKNPSCLNKIEFTFSVLELPYFKIIYIFFFFLILIFFLLIALKLA